MYKQFHAYLPRLSHSVEKKLSLALFGVIALVFTIFSSPVCAQSTRVDVPTSEFHPVGGTQWSGDRVQVGPVIDHIQIIPGIEDSFGDVHVYPGEALPGRPSTGSTSGSEGALSPNEPQVGCPNYSYGADAIAEMHNTILTIEYYTTFLLGAAAAIFAIISALKIYFKMQIGEQGVTKDILYLFGSILFLLASFLIFPGLFGWETHPI